MYPSPTSAFVPAVGTERLSAWVALAAQAVDAPAAAVRLRAPGGAGWVLAAVYGLAEDTASDLREGLASGAVSRRLRSVWAQLTAPLVWPGGEGPGELLILDRRPRRWSERDRKVVGRLSSLLTQEVPAPAWGARPRCQGEGEEALDAEAHYRRLVGAHPYGIFVLDRQGRFTEVNPALVDLLGCPRDQLLGRHCTEVVVPVERPGIRRFFQGRTAGRREPRDYHTRVRAATGEERSVHIRTISIVEGGRVTEVHGVVRDITDEQRAETALREREEQLRHAQKLEAVGRLAGGIAHDFNNLLMVIQGTVNLMLMDPPADGAHRADLEEILRATERGASLTRQLLAFSRKQVLRPRVVSLNTAMAELHKMVRRVIGEDIELVTSLASDLGRVRVDPGQLEQVVLNLVVNARDAMPGGGRLEIRTSNAELTEADAQRHPYRVVPGPYVRLCVQDTGSGMPEGVLNRIFEPFFTTKEQGKGTGLGMSMVYGIIKQSEGYIWASSQPGHGTSIDIYLPRVEGGEDPGASAGAAPAPGGMGTVLLVEDETHVRSVTRRLLERSGYTVLEAACGREAVARFDAHPGTVDLLLTDVVMPEMNGRKLANQLLARRPDLKVLYMSGYADDRGVRRGRGEGADDFIQKPFAPGLLLERVHAMLAG